MLTFMRLILWPAVIGTLVTIFISQVFGSGEIDRDWFTPLLAFNITVVFGIGVLFSLRDRRRR